MSNGGEMMSKVREIAYHFDTHGTPIMIGESWMMCHFVY